AGAIVDGRTMARASALGLNPEEFLDNNDSYSFFGALHDLVVTGPTGTNVADLVLFLAHRPVRDRRERLSRSSGRGRASPLGSSLSDSAHSVGHGVSVHSHEYALGPCGRRGGSKFQRRVRACWGSNPGQRVWRPPSYPT